MFSRRLVALTLSECGARKSFFNLEKDHLRFRDSACSNRCLRKCASCGLGSYAHRRTAETLRPLTVFQALMLQEDLQGAISPTLEFAKFRQVSILFPSQRVDVAP